MTADRDTLVLAWGNPGRRDDGIGPAIAEALEQPALPGVTVSSGYQLQVEDALEAARHRRVVFVDADRAGPAPFSFTRLAAAGDGLAFTTHSVSPGALLALARDLFGAEPEAWLMAVRGNDFSGFGEGLSTAGRANAQQASAFLREGLIEGRWRQPGIQAGVRPNGGAP